MKRSLFLNKQIVNLRLQAEGGEYTGDLDRKHGVSGRARIRLRDEVRESASF